MRPDARSDSEVTYYPDTKHSLNEREETIPDRRVA
jgi:hypothetical protein